MPGPVRSQPRRRPRRRVHDDLDVHPRHSGLRARPARLDRVARAGAPVHGQALRHPRPAVHGRLRPDRVVAQEGRHRVRHQGHPAGRLHPHDRHVPAGQHRPDLRPLHLAVARDDRGRPLGGLRGAPARRRDPHVLHPQAVEAGHRHVRGPVHEPGPRGRPVLHGPDGLRHPAADHHRLLRLALRHRAEREPRHLQEVRPGLPGRGRRHPEARQDRLLRGHAHQGLEHPLRPDPRQRRQERADRRGARRQAAHPARQDRHQPGRPEGLQRHLCAGQVRQGRVPRLQLRHRRAEAGLRRLRDLDDRPRR
ncbi:hypothetical protein SGPA1_11363 [Streptomyces misionensis JCM 4497]